MFYFSLQFSQVIWSKLLKLNYCEDLVGLLRSVNNMLFWGFELGNLQRQQESGVNIFPIFHFTARDRCHHPGQSFTILEIFVSVTSQLMDVAEGQWAPHRGRCRWDLSSEDQEQHHCPPSRVTFLRRRPFCVMELRWMKKKESDFEIPHRHDLERANIPGLQ